MAKVSRIAARSATKGAAWFLILGTALVAMSWTPNLNVRPVPNTDSLVLEGMLRAHGCWQRSAPEGVIPGHVVVTLQGEDRPTYGGQRLTTDALNQMLFGKGYVGQVHGFCR